MGGLTEIYERIIDTSRFTRSQRNSSSKTKTPAINITDLPPELLSQIFERLKGRDVASASCACKSFYEASFVEKIWQTRCNREFGIALASGRDRTRDSFSYKSLYSKVLYKYGHLIGEWQPEITHYGGLVEVKYENGKLYGIEWRATCTSRPLRRINLFSIGLGENDHLEILCLGGYKGPHNCQLTIKSDKGFNAKCCLPDSHHHPEGHAVELRDWAEMGATPRNSTLKLMKFLHIQKYENSFDYRPLQIPGIAPTSNAVIQPGLFQGLYGDHGLEIIALTYEDGVVAKAIKLSGDPNIPYSQITFRVDLRYSMVLNENQQMTMESLMQIKRISSNVLPQDLPMQPFRIPANISFYEGTENLPNICKARFFGSAQIAGHGFTNPSYINGHWIVFNENVFAFIFLELSSITIYQRCIRDSSNCQLIV